MNNRKVSALFLLALISTSAVLFISLNIEPAQSTIPSYPVSGHVYDLTGNPAGHASVYLVDTINGRGANRGVYCDTAGYYYITVQAGTYNIVSHLVGTNQSFSQNGLVVSGDVTKDMKLVGGYKVSGHVYDSKGQTVAGAITSIGNATWSVPADTSDASGYYAIYAPAGTYRFTLWPPTNTNYIDYENATFKITSDMTYDIVMSSGYTVSGVVQYPSGVKVSGVTTYLLNSTGYTFTSGRYTDAQWSSGTYSIVAPPGNYTLQAKLNSVLVYKEANVTLKDTDITKDITLIKASLSPSYAVVDAGQSFAYTASATGGSGNGNYVEYTWYVNDAVQATTNNSTFNFTPAQAGTYSITVVAKDTSGAYSPQSAPVSATVNPALIPPELSASPNSLDQGQTSMLTATEASAGTGSYSYQWYSKAPNAASYAIISGATSLDYTFATKLSTEAGKWSFILNVTDGATSPNTVPSKAVTVLVNKAPTVTVTPQLAIANEGSPLTLTALVSGGSGSMTYEWFLDNTQVGGNSTSYTYVATSGTHSLYVKVTDSANPPLSATSNAVTISTNPALVAPTISAVTSVIDQGQAFKLNSTAPISGTAPYLYQWFAREPNGDYAPLVGATSANCSIPTASNITAGVWYLVLHVTDSATTPSTVASNVITVTVNAAPTVSISPASAALTVGQSSTFTATATAGSGVYTAYQWYVNGTAQQGQNSTTFSFSPSSAGSYSVTATVTDSFGATSSASTAALVQTSPAPTPTPAPTQTPTATTTPTVTPNPSTKATPTPAPTATQNPTATPTPTQPTPTQNITQGPDTGTYVIVSIALAVVVVVLIGFILASKRTKKK